MWLKQVVSNPDDIVQFMQDCSNNIQAYELIYMFIYYLVPYWITRSSIKYNHKNEMELWRYWIHLFIAARKKHYAIISLRHLWILKSLSPDVLQAYYSNRVFSADGLPGTGIAHDAKLEMLNKEVKHLNTAGFYEQSLAWTAHSLNIIEPVMQQVHEFLRKPKNEAAKFVNGTQLEAQKLADIISSKFPTISTHLPNARFNNKFWYPENFDINDDLLDELAPSIHVENSFAGMGRWYINHQDVWDNSLEEDEAVVVETDEPSFWIDENEDPLDISYDVMAQSDLF